MGVVTVTDIDYGQIFGPFPTQLTATDPVYVIGLLTYDKPPDGIMLKVDTQERREGVMAVDWLPYVSPARDADEQNMEAYLKEDGVYYRTLRIVKAGEELLVWYSKDFTQILGVPELQTNCKRDNEQFICSHCGEMFDFPYPLRAHLKFRCSLNTDDVAVAFLADQAKLNGGRPEITNCNKYTHRLQDRSPSALTYMTNNNTMSTIYSKRHITIEHDNKSQHKKFISDSHRPRKDSALSYSIDELVGKNADQGFQENGLDSHSEIGSAFRKVEKLTNLTPEHRVSSPACVPCFVSVSKSITSPIRSSQPVLVMSSSSSLLEHRHYQPNKPHRPAPSPVDQNSSLSMPPPPRPSVKAMPSLGSIPHRESTLSGAPIIGLYMPRIPLLSPPSPLGTSGGSLLTAGSSGRGMPIPHSAFPDQIPPGLLEMCRATIPTIGPLTESFAANIRNSETLAKQALFADRHISTLSFLKSTNPMVEKLLQSTNPTLLSSPINAINLSQNWCAKCNATFRMTSDLVYHMRSHHKREFDPMKRKREEKLKCNICNEAFRERHHLTRHMSSHA